MPSQRKANGAGRPRSFTTDPLPQWYVPAAPITANKFLRGPDSAPESTTKHQPSSPFGKMTAVRSATAKRGTVNPRRQYEGAEAWLNDKLNRSFDSISLRKGGAFVFSNAGVEDRPKMTPAEYSILRHISVREHMKNDLQKLVENQTNNGLSAVILEVEEMVKAIRFETIDVVEEISAWIDAQPVKRPFLYQGVNYLVKVCTDLGFLDQHKEIVERFCFEFKMNPLAYLGGGKIILGFGALEAGVGGGGGGSITSKSSKQSYLQSLASRKGSVYQAAMDVDIDRLQHAERLIQQEFERRRGLPAPVPQVGYLDTLSSLPGHGPVLSWGPAETALVKPSAISFIEDAGAGYGAADASVDHNDADDVADGDRDDPSRPHHTDAEPFSKDAEPPPLAVQVRTALSGSAACPTLSRSGAPTPLFYRRPLPRRALPCPVSARHLAARRRGRGAGGLGRVHPAGVGRLVGRFPPPRGGEFRPCGGPRRGAGVGVRGAGSGSRRCVRAVGGRCPGAGDCRQCQRHRRRDCARIDWFFIKYEYFRTSEV